MYSGGVRNERSAPPCGEGPPEGSPQIGRRCASPMLCDVIAMQVPCPRVSEAKQAAFRDPADALPRHRTTERRVRFQQGASCARASYLLARGRRRGKLITRPIRLRRRGWSFLGVIPSTDIYIIGSTPSAVPTQPEWSPRPGNSLPRYKNYRADPFGCLWRFAPQMEHDHSHDHRRDYYHRHDRERRRGALSLDFRR